MESNTNFAVLFLENFITVAQYMGAWYRPNVAWLTRFFPVAASNADLKHMNSDALLITVDRADDATT